MTSRLIRVTNTFCFYKELAISIIFMASLFFPGTNVWSKKHVDKNRPLFSGKSVAEIRIRLKLWLTPYSVNTHFQSPVLLV